jgi:putative hemolysin
MASENQKIQFAQAAIEFFREPTSGLILSISCLEKPCLAKKNLQKISFDQYRKAKKGSGNPSSYFCEIIEGKVVIGKTQEGNEISYCKFSDNSFIEGGSLTKSAKENDVKK